MRFTETRGACNIYIENRGGVYRHIGKVWNMAVRNEYRVLNLRNRNNGYLEHGNMTVSITLPRGIDGPIEHTLCIAFAYHQT